MMASILQDLLARRELSEDQIRNVFSEMMQGRCGEAETAAFLVGLRMKGETSSEIAAAARVLRAHMLCFDPGRADVLDTCGTGGDGRHTFNISTATAFVIAGAGVPVVKHGNRSVSSQSGSADVLAALGVSIDGDGIRARQCLDQAGLAFCFAPQFHPALKHVGPVRKKLGIPTIFNCLGPLANPARAPFQLLGVGRPELLDLMAGALRQLETARAVVVCSLDGLDEVSLSAPTQVRIVTPGGIQTLEWSVEDFQLEPCTLEELHAADMNESARIVDAILQGKAGPARRIVLANAAAGLLAGGKVQDLRAGVAAAAEAIDSGRAAQVLDRLRKL